MTIHSWLLLGLYLVILLAAVKPLGLYITNIMETPQWAPIARLETAMFRLCGIGDKEMGWRQYAMAVLLFSLIGFIVVYGLQRLQAWLPLNPQHMVNVST